MNWLTVFLTTLGEAEAMVPVFIHNPKSQQIEAVVVTQVNKVSESFAQLQAQKMAAQTPASAPTPSTPAAT